VAEPVAGPEATCEPGEGRHKAARLAARPGRGMHGALAHFTIRVNSKAANENWRVYCGDARRSGKREAGS
jgi:hypothetical protein